VATISRLLKIIGLRGFCKRALKKRRQSAKATNIVSSHLRQRQLQGGEDAWAALSCRSLFAKEPPVIGPFCGKRPIKIRHPVGVRHTVTIGFSTWEYGVATISRLLKIIGLFCKRAL